MPSHSIRDSQFRGGESRPRLHHFLPATYLASFSEDKTTLPRRERILVVGDRVSGRTFRAAASRVGAINNLYTLADRSSDPQLLERLWARYEQDLPDAVSRLIEGRVDGRTWARVLVPFVACMLVRGPDFDQRFAHRLRALGLASGTSLLTPDNTNGGRLLDLQRLLGPVTAAKWLVIAVSGEPLITNDLGWAPFVNTRTSDAGLAIPLGHAHVLAIVPSDERTVAVVQSGRWIPVIDYVQEPLNNHVGLNRALAQMALWFTYGPTEDVVSRYVERRRRSDVIPEPGNLGFLTPRFARAHEFTWHRLVAALEKDLRGHESWDFPLDWEAIAKGWHPPVFFPLNLPEFPPALEWDGDSIRVRFYDPEVYYSLSAVKELAEIGRFDILVEEATKGLQTADRQEHTAALLVARAGALTELARYEEALADCDAAIEADPSFAPAHASKGVALAKTNRVPESVECFTRALELNTEMALARVNRGNALGMLGKHESALDDLSAAMSSLPDGPGKAAALESRGNVLVEMGSYEPAVEDFHRAINLYPDVPERVRCYFRSAVAHFLGGKHRQALDDAQRAIEGELNFDAWLLKSQIHSELGETQEAISALTVAGELAQDGESRATALHQKAIKHAEIEQLEHVLSDLELARALSPNNSAIDADIGLTLLMQARFPEAIAALDRALDRNPHNPKAHNNRGVALAMRGNHLEAIASFNQAVRDFHDDPEAASAYRNKAVSLAITGRCEEADEAMGQAEVIAADSLLTLLAKGLVECYRGDYERATEFLRIAQGDSGEENQYLALPLLCSGQASEALSILQRFRERKPSPMLSHHILMHLKTLKQRLAEAKGFDEAISMLDIAD